MGIPCGILPLQMAAPMNPAERVRERIRHWMDTTKIGQREFASDLDKSQVWLQKVLSGENDVRLKHLDDVARALRTTAAELVRGEEDRYQFELTPTEVRILERMRHRQHVLRAVAALLGLDGAEVEVSGSESNTKKKRG